MKLHPLTWLAWLAAVLVPLSLSRNPWYLLLVLGILTLVNISLRPANENAPIPVSPLRFGLVVVTLSMLFNALTVHFGSTVLFRLPKLLPVIGGIITLEALVFGLLNGLVLTAIFLAFTLVNRALPVRALIQLIPRAFYPVAVVASIAVTFVPVTLRQFQQIREAQAVRGHRLRGVRDWLPLLIPLLVGGLERALQLAEAMTARGFANTTPSPHEVKTRLTIVAGLSLLLSGYLLRLAWGQAAWGLIFLISGTGLIVGTLWLIGRRRPHTIYRPTPWTRQDGGVLLGAALTVLLFLLPWPGLERSSIFYYPYPALSLPGFEWRLGLATLGLLGPALVMSPGERLPRLFRNASRRDTEDDRTSGVQAASQESLR